MTTMPGPWSPSSHCPTHSRQPSQCREHSNSKPLRICRRLKFVGRGSDAVRADRPYYRQGKGSRSTSVSSLKFWFRCVDQLTEFESRTWNILHSYLSDWDDVFFQLRNLPLALRHRLCHLLLCSVPAAHYPSTASPIGMGRPGGPPLKRNKNAANGLDDHVSRRPLPRSEAVSHTGRLMFNPCVERFFTATKRSDWHPKTA